MEFQEGSASKLEKDNYKLAGITLLVGCLQFFMAVTFAETQFPGYSIRETLSTLGGSVPLVEPSAMVFNVSTIIFGLLGLITAYLIFKSGGDRFFPSLLAISAVGAIGVGFVPQYTGNPHLVFALVVFLFASLATIFSYRLGLNNYMFVISLIVGFTSLILILSVVFLGSGNPLEAYLGKGGLERSLAYPCLFYLAALGGYLTGRGEDLG